MELEQLFEEVLVESARIGKGTFVIGPQFGNDEQDILHGRISVQVDDALNNLKRIINLKIPNRWKGRYNDMLNSITGIKEDLQRMIHESSKK